MYRCYVQVIYLVLNNICTFMIISRNIFTKMANIPTINHNTFTYISWQSKLVPVL